MSENRIEPTIEYQGLKPKERQRVKEMVEEIKEQWSIVKSELAGLLDEKNWPGGDIKEIEKLAKKYPNVISALVRWRKQYLKEAEGTVSQENRRPDDLLFDMAYPKGVKEKLRKTKEWATFLAFVSASITALLSAGGAIYSKFQPETPTLDRLVGASKEQVASILQTASHMVELTGNKIDADTVNTLTQNLEILLQHWSHTVKDVPTTTALAITSVLAATLTVAIIAPAIREERDDKLRYVAGELLDAEFDGPSGKHLYLPGRKELPLESITQERLTQYVDEWLSTAAEVIQEYKTVLRYAKDDEDPKKYESKKQALQQRAGELVQFGQRLADLLDASHPEMAGTTPRWVRNEGGEESFRDTSKRKIMKDRLSILKDIKAGRDFLFSK